MKRINIICLILLIIASILYDYKQPEIIEKKDTYSVVTLDGAFKIKGEYKFEGTLTVKELVNKVGVKDNASLACLSMSKEVKDESSIYLPTKNLNAISLNKATKEQLMTLKGVGDKTADKIIEYRKTNKFTCLEDIMNVKGIGEKTFIKLRDSLCL